MLQGTIFYYDESAPRFNPYGATPLLYNPTDSFSGKQPQKISLITGHRPAQ